VGEVEVTPIGPALQAEVVAATRARLDEAARILDCALPLPPIRFDLRGRCAGMYRVHQGTPEIRFNPYLFARYFRENIDATVPHEVAHYAIDRARGRRRVRPHGREWRALMLALGAEPQVRADFALDGIPIRRLRTHGYRCACRVHELTAIRHGRALRGGSYVCRACGVRLEWIGGE